MHVGDYTFDGYNSSGGGSSVQITYADILVDASVVTAGSETASMMFNLQNGTGAQATAFSISPTGVTSNGSITALSNLVVFGSGAISNGLTVNNPSGTNITTDDSIFLLKVGGDNVIEIDTSTSNKIFTFRGINSETPQSVLWRNDSTPNNGNTIGRIRFDGNDSTLAQTVYAQIDAIASDVANGSEDGRLEFSVKDGGAIGTSVYMTMTGGIGTVINSSLTVSGSVTKIGTGTTQKIGFWGATPVTRPTVTGSRGGNAALASLLTALANEGLITNSTSA